MSKPWPPEQINNEFGIATLSLGSWRHHDLPGRLRVAAKAGFKWIDLFDEDWAEHLQSNGQDREALWEPTEANLRIAKHLGDLVKSLGMSIACTQTLRKIEGIKDPMSKEPLLISWRNDSRLCGLLTRTWFSYAQTSGRTLASQVIFSQLREI
jgi:4-hydroxyphenylpyruvate dioxygenase